MTLILPQPSTSLQQGEHSFLHRVIAVDAAAPEQSLIVNADGSITFSHGLTGVVSSFNTRTGAVSLLSADVTGALGYTPLNAAIPGSTGDLLYNNGGTLGNVTLSASDGNNMGFGNVTSGFTFTSPLVFQNDALGITAPTTAQSFVIQNTTAAISSLSQDSPGLSFLSNGWGTTAGTSQNITWKIYSSVTTSTVPTATLLFQSSIAGGAFTNRLQVSSAGTVTITSLSSAGVITNTASTAVITNTRTAIAVTSTDGMVNSNTTASTSGVPAQWSPRIRLSGTAWNTGGTPATNTDDWILENQTVSGNPTSANLVFSSQLNAAGYVAQLKISSGGVLTVTTSLVIAGGTALTTTNQTGTGSIVMSSSPTLTTPALGTPSAVVLTNGTGLPVSTGISGLATGIATFLATPTSANLAAAITDETGSGSLVFATGPTITGATLTTTSVNGVTLTTGGGTTNFLRADGTYAAPSGGGTGITWNTVSGTTQTAAVNNGYIANNASLVTITLPTTAAVGSIIEVAWQGAGGWKIAQSSGQSIIFGTKTTTTGTGGSLASFAQGDSIRINCITANTTFEVLSSQGNITVV